MESILDFIREYFFLYAFAIAGGACSILAAQHYTHKRFIVQLLQAIEEERAFNQKYFANLLQQLDERTNGTITYAHLKVLFGDHEANTYLANALRLCSKFGLKPGYYKVDEHGYMALLNLKEEKGKPDRSKMPPQKRFRILQRDGFRCQICGYTADKDATRTLHVDHRMPRSKGGSDHESNLWTLCSECNAGKTDLVVPELINDEDPDSTIYASGGAA